MKRWLHRLTDTALTLILVVLVVGLIVAVTAMVVPGHPVAIIMIIGGVFVFFIVAQRIGGRR